MVNEVNEQDWMVDLIKEKVGIEDDFQVCSLDNHIKDGATSSEIKKWFEEEEEKEMGFRWSVLKAVQYTALENRTEIWVGDTNCIFS